MTAYYRTQISDKYGKTIPIVYEGEWYGEKFTGTDEKGFEIIVRKKEWIFFNREQENKELKGVLNELSDYVERNNISVPYYFRQKVEQNKH